MARTRTRPTRQDTVEQLLEGARQAFVERGFHGARVEDICASAGLSRGAFYSGFSKKEDLFLALYDRVAAQVQDLFAGALDEAARRHQDPVDALFATLAARYPLGRDWYVLNAEFTLFAIRNADAAKALGERRHALRAMIVENLTQALTRSGRKPTVSLDLLARALVGLADAGLGQSLIDPQALGPTSFIEVFMAPLVHALSDKALPPAIDAPDRLLAAAETVFARDGYGAARLSDIATTAGISKATIYEHFSSKAELFTATMRAAIARLADAIDLTGDMRATLIAHGRAVLSEAGMQVYRLVQSETRQFPELAAFYDDALRGAIDAPAMLIDMVMAQPLRLALAGRPLDQPIEQRVDDALAFNPRRAAGQDAPR